MERREPASALIGLTSNNSLIRFDSAAPGTTTTVAITGLQGGATEILQGIDFRPRTGQLFAIGIVLGATDMVRTYTIDPISGVATQVPGSSPVSVTSGTFYGTDFNPTVDRIRVVNTNDENLRINPNNGVRADNPVNDTDLNPAGRLIDGVAYDRNFDSGLAVGSRTTLYGISRSGTSQLVTIGGVNQSPSPNLGAVMNVGAIGFTPSAAAGLGFDITARNAAFLGMTVGTTAGLYTVNLGSGAASLVGTIGNGSIGLRGLAAIPDSTLATGADAGGGPHVRVFDGFSGTQKFSLFPYPVNFTGGARVATGDVNLDGAPDIVTAAGPGGGPHVRVFDGVTGTALPGPVGSFFAYDTSFTGGVNVAVGDVNADGNKDIITGADVGGGAHVRVFSGANGNVLVEFFAYDSAFRGGVRVASADFDLDGDYEIVTGAGPTGGPHVRVFDNAGNPFVPASLPDFANSLFAYGTTFTGGVNVAAGDVNGDGVPEVITGAGAGGGPHVRAFSGVNGSDVASLFAYEASFAGGVRVGVADFNADGRYEIRAAPGPGRSAEIRTFAPDGQLLDNLNVYPGFNGGAFVTGVRD
jgi:hypothetical protein